MAFKAHVLWGRLVSCRAPTRNAPVLGLCQHRHSGGFAVFYFFNKVLLLAVYGIALGSFLTTLPLSPNVIYWVRIAAMVLVTVHLLEVVVCFKKVALHKGPLFDSMLLTLLFGFLHWKPMADAAQRTR